MIPCESQHTSFIPWHSSFEQSLRIFVFNFLLMCIKISIDLRKLYFTIHENYLYQYKNNFFLLGLKSDVTKLILFFISKL